MQSNSTIKSWIENNFMEIVGREHKISDFENQHSIFWYSRPLEIKHPNLFRRRKLIIRQVAHIERILQDKSEKSLILKMGFFSITRNKEVKNLVILTS